MKALLFAIALVITMEGHAFAQSNLVKPVVNKPTVRTEILRGINATDLCIGVSHSATRYRPDDYFLCVKRIETENTRKNTNNDAFGAGLFFHAWNHAAL